MVIVFTIITFCSTLLGGLFALRFKDQLHLILGFSAGAVIAVSFFDLLPEALSLGNNYYSLQVITAIVALGFLFYMILDRMALLHFHTHSNEPKMKGKGNLAAGSLSIHSFFDGIAIGLAFQISHSVGIFVAVAVIAHDFSDGLNTVSVVLRNNGKTKDAFKWLLADSIAPVLGVASTFFFHLPENAFSIVLAVLCGFFFYIGASDLLPESQHEHPSLWTTITTLIGVAVIYVAIRFSNF
ncbi:MAG TPA: ZIP family metal transporter [Chitinophagaceae bacterium]|nr:ZIP family metal transporter [Chitinophagaceae bacterium]